MFRNRLIVSFCALMLLASAALPGAARAAGTITVNTAMDTTGSDLSCSLREAITNSNNNAATFPDCAAGSGHDTIVFAGGVTTITLGSTLPTVNDAAGLTIDGGGDVILSGSDVYRVFWVDSQLTVDGLTVTHGACSACIGGGIYSSGGSLNIVDSTFSNNGSAVFDYAGPVTIANSTFSGNSDTFGAAVSSEGPGSSLTVSNSTFSGNSSPSGGGSAIYNDQGPLNVTNSTFSGNSAPDGRGAIYNSGSANIANSTFSGNSSSGVNEAGAIFNQGSMTITNSTFSGNSITHASGQFGGAADIYQLGAASTLSLYNVIIANDAGGGHCSIEAGSITGNNNLVDDASNTCGFTDGVSGNIVGSDAHLGTLTGSPAFLPLQAGSPAIDAGDDTACSAAPVNNSSENGNPRPQGTHCDIGAFEFDAVAPTVSSIARADADPTSASSVDFTVSFSETVTGVDSADFSLAVSGVSGAAITGVTGSGATRTVTVNTGSGSGTIQLDIPASASITDLGTNPLAGLPYTSGQAYTLNRTLTVTSSGRQDGWVLESSETSGAGGTLNSAAGTFLLGDDATNRQYRAILSFDTSALPDNATIQSAQLLIKQSGAPLGKSPFKVLGSLQVDIRLGSFGTPALKIADFKSAASAAKAGAFSKTPAAGWYSDAIGSAGLLAINLTGLTQLRLYFTKDDNNDFKANTMKFLSGNTASPANRPTLVIIYSVP